MKTIIIDDKTVILNAQTPIFEVFNIYREDKHLLKAKIKRNDVYDFENVYEYIDLSYVKQYKLTYNNALTTVMQITTGRVKDAFQYIKNLIDGKNEGFFEYNNIDIIID